MTGAHPAAGLIDDPQLLADCEAAAAPFAVSPTVHAHDFIFNYFLANAGLPQAQAVQGYFASGRGSADRVAALIAPLGLPETPRVLEFASGYGCVTRHLRGSSPPLPSWPATSIRPC